MEIEGIMTSKKNGYLWGAIAGVSIATAAVAGARVGQPDSTLDRTMLLKASTAPIFAPPPGAPLSFADIFELSLIHILSGPERSSASSDRRGLARAPCSNV